MSLEHRYLLHGTRRFSKSILVSTSSGALLESTGKPVLNERTGMYEYRTKDGKDAWIRKEQVVEILER